MSGLITWITSLDDSSLIAAVSCLIALASALIAKSNVNLTNELVSETRKMRESQTEPNIYVYIQLSEDFSKLVYMFVQNIGLGPARDIKFEVPNFQCSEFDRLDDMPIIKNGIKYLAPNQRMQIFLSSIPKIFDLNTEYAINIGVEYTNIVGKKYNESHQIDFFAFSKIQRYVPPSPLSSLVESVKKIEDDMNKISSTMEKVTESSINNTNKIEEKKQQL